MAPVNARIYTKISEHRGRRRLWLEGRKLERAGILPGQRFSLTWDEASGKVVLRFSEDGERKVSRREKNGREMPIIDVSSTEIEDAFGAGLERAKVSIRPGEITVEVHPDDAATRERFDRLINTVRAGRPISTGSLAHGGGVLDHAIHTGLADVGIKSRLAFAVEMDADTLEASASNNSIWDDQSVLIEAPMQEVDLNDIPKVDILVAGLPCTGASKAGKAKNAIETAEDHPTAGALFVSFLRVVKHANPSLIVMENVVEYANEVSAKVVRASLETWGYHIHETILNGNEFGALEKRRRWCMLAVSKDFTLDLDQLLPVREKERTLGEILQEVDPGSDMWRDIGHLVDKAARDKAAGKGFKMNMVGAEDETIGTIGARYWKWRSTEPKIPHPTKEGWARQLTPAEHAAVKAVPAALVDGISNTLAHQILGNSVIWSAWRAVGQFLGSSINDHSGVLDLDPEIKQMSLFEVLERMERLDARRQADLQPAAARM